MTQDGRSSGMNSKQQKTRQSMSKEGDGEALRQMDMVMRSYITHNKGGKWELIKAPAEDSQGRKTNCYLEDGCSLHL